MTSTLSIQHFKVSDKGSNRTVWCPYCEKTVKRSIVPHMRKMHGEIWNQWCFDFVQLYNEGYSSKQIMKKYNILFSWTVVEREIKRIAEEKKVRLVAPKVDVKIWQPKEFKKETTTFWEFPQRGDWCVHSGDYRGNWAPQVPRNIILQYSRKGETVLDCFLGGGTTIIECWLLERNGVGIDISPHAINMSKQRMQEMRNIATEKEERLQSAPTIVCGDARELPLSEKSIDLVCCQPPYADAIAYTWNVKGDLSRISEVEVFCNAMQYVAEEIYRVLKVGKRCVLMIGDVRRKKMIVPLGFRVMQKFLEVGFSSEEIIIKKQYKDRSTEFYLKKGKKHDILRYRIQHEYLFVFQKPSKSVL